MATLIGRVGMVVKGAWDSSVAYDEMDVVTYNNSTYIAKQASPEGTLPTNTTYWQLALDASQLQPKEAGKGLSTNDYTDADKAIVGGVTSALAGKVDRKYYAISANSSITITVAKNCLFSSTSYTAAYLGFGVLKGWITEVIGPIMNQNSSWTITGGVENNKFTIANNTAIDRDMNVIEF